MMFEFNEKRQIKAFQGTKQELLDLLKIIEKHREVQPK